MRAETLFDLAYNSKRVSKTFANLASVCEIQKGFETGLPVYFTVTLNAETVTFTIDRQHPCENALHELLRQLIVHEQLSACDELNTMSRRIVLEEVSK